MISIFKINSWPKMAVGFQPSVQILISRYKEEMKEATSPSMMVNCTCQTDSPQVPRLNTVSVRVLPDEISI